MNFKYLLIKTNIVRWTTSQAITNLLKESSKFLQYIKSSTEFTERKDSR